MNNNDRFQFRAWDTVACRYEYEIQYSLFDYYIDDDRYVIEQCTGLKDKSGRLIYEGDIISVFDIARGVIDWDKSQYQIIRCQSKLPKRLKYMSIRNLETERFVEIIGNIHENPELMEVENNGSAN